MPSPSLNSNNKPGWFPRLVRGIASRIDPEIYEQGPIEMTRYGVIRRSKSKDGSPVFGEFEQSSSQFAIERPGGGHHIDPEKALANNRGYVYAAVNAKAREVMNIDFRLFSVDGKDHEEQDSHELLDLLDAVNPDMIGSELKYLTSAHLDLVGNAYWLLADKNGNPVKTDLEKPETIYILDPSKTTPVVDYKNFPFRITGYKMKMGERNMVFNTSSIIHFRLPDPSNPFEGRGIVQAGAEYIDNDNYAMEFNRKFFVNGARPAMFLETDMVAETQIQSLKIGFTDVHGGIDNMNKIGVLPKGVKATVVGTSPKDMDFKNLSEDMRDRILALFGVSKTILGTAESDTNRATAETADYVFSKRVIRPHIQLIVGFLNEKLVPRYRDNLYISFIDPVPEDRQFRMEEMQAATGKLPLLTVNEGRDEYMGLGPVDGGDTLMSPTLMAPIGKPQADGNVTPGAGKIYGKAIEAKVQKAANGQRVAFRPARTKLTTRATARAKMAESLSKSIAEKLKQNLSPKKFESTKEQDEAVWKRFSDYTYEAENDIRETMKRINDDQKKEVLANLPKAIGKGIDPSRLFDMMKWVSITVSALTPIMETLFQHQASAAANEIGKPEIETFDEVTRVAVHRSVEKMSESYNETTLTALEDHINEGLQNGESLAEITKRVEQVYEWSNESRAAMVARTESFRTANDALKTAWKQSGVVKTIRWYTSESSRTCAFCASMDGKTIGIDENFFDAGDTLTVDDGGTDKTMSMDYGAVGAPPIHPQCMCFIRPDTIDIS